MFNWRRPPKHKSKYWTKHSKTRYSQDFSNSYYIYYSYNLSSILTEYDKLNKQKDTLQIYLQKGTDNYTMELETHNNILNFNFYRLNNKIRVLFNKRIKRGLVNGFGTIIKTITGNLDASDGEKYDKLFKQIKQNENKLQNQNLENIRISKELTEKFNQQLENIKFNELVLKSRLVEIESFLKTEIEWQHLFLIKDTFNQLISTSINLIEILNEIETSLSFCNLNMIHSSIILPNDLYKVTKQIFAETKLTFDNFWAFAKLMKSHCRVSSNMIRYLIEVPLYLENTKKWLL